MATETLRPDGPGAETVLQPYGNGANWECVDEDSPDDGTTYVYWYTTTGYRRDLYDLPASAGSGTINFIKIYFRVRGYETMVGDALIHAKPALRSDTTVTDGTEVSVTSWQTFSEQWNTNPVGGAWEWADIDALQIGISLDIIDTARYAYCTQIYVEVDYTPPAVPANPLIGKPLIAPDIIRKAKIR